MGIVEQKEKTIMYTIMGATGNVGGRIAGELLAKGKEVRAIGRSAERLQSLVDKRAQAAVGKITDREFLKEAFRGSTAVFFMIPPNFAAENYKAYQNEITDNGVAAITDAGVKHVVVLSSQGAHMTEGNGVVEGLAAMERKFAGLDGVNVLNLRPAFFMENFMNMMGMIKTANMNGSNLKSSVKFPMIAAKDIATAGADALLALDFQGKSHRDLLGQRDLSMGETTKIIGAAIGKPELPYVELPPEAMKKGIMDMGMNENIAGAMVEYYEGLNSGAIQGDATRSPGNTTETPFEEFAQVFAVVYKK